MCTTVLVLGTYLLTAMLACISNSGISDAQFMETNYNYTCPSCSIDCTVAEVLTGQNVVCPHCAQEFFATSPDNNSQVTIPKQLPFFKSGRKKILKDRLRELTADGELSANDDSVLTKTALAMGLTQAELQEIAKEEFLREFSVLQSRIEKAWQLTDKDLQEIDALKRKHGVKNLTLQGTADLFRQIYLLDVKGQMPKPVEVDLLLKQGEKAHYCVSSTWHQTRVQRRGYAGASVSIPSGIKGVRFRFGQYTPVRTEEITPLASGTLYVTTHRLLFQGDNRNTSVDLKKIVDAEIMADCLKIEKATGKPDYYSMSPAEARFVALLIERLREV